MGVVDSIWTVGAARTTKARAAARKKSDTLDIIAS
jgi:hypothetical protein